MEVAIADVGLIDVTALRFDFANVQNGYVGYTEIDALGSSSAAVPEPASVAIWSMIGLGLAGFGVYRARRKK